MQNCDIRSTLVGMSACVSIALGMAMLFCGHVLEPLVPVVFLVVIAVVTMKFGVAAGLAGSVAATAIFALLLFKPIGSFWVNDLNERSNLIWMLFIGSFCSFLTDNIIPDEWLHIARQRNRHKALASSLSSRSRRGAMNADRELLILLAFFTAACLFILWWVLRYPVPPN